MARQAFDKAIKVYSDAGDKRKIAETNLAIGDECEKLLQRVTRDDSYLIVETPGEAPPDEPQMAEVRRQRLNRKVQLEDDLRRIAAHYFKAASDEQDRSGKPDEAAEMLLRAGAVLSGSKLATLKGQAADVFTRASQRYEKANNMEQQTSALTSAGDVFREAENKELWPRADEYYEQAAKTYHDAGLKDKEAGTLTSIGQSYGSSDDPGQKRKGISYYERAARIYGEIQNKSAAGNALINAASLWEDIVGEEAQVQAAAFYDRAVAVYENDVPKQVSTLIRIGRSLARSTNERRILKSQAYFQKAVVLAEQTGDRKAGASAYLDVGVAYQGLRNYALAIPNFERARSIYQEVNDSFGQGMALYRLATVHNLTPATKAKAPELADQSLAQLALALPGVWSSGDKKGLADTHYAIGSLYRLKKDYARALESYTTAYDLYRTLTGQAQRVSATLYTIKQLKKQLGKAP
jgi:tetratricopeptide (TPR) repeat protein